MYHKAPPLLYFERLFATVQLAHKCGVDDIVQQGIEALTEYYANKDAAYDKPNKLFADLADVHAIGAIHAL